jgi:hypothetical protein
MSGFVDDMKGQTNDMASKYPLLLHTLIARMQVNAQLWGDLSGEEPYNFQMQLLRYEMEFQAQRHPISQLRREHGSTARERQQNGEHYSY